MNLSQLFIERPIMTVLVCLSIILFGVVGVPRLAGGGVCPAWTIPPSLVAAGLPGASPETMASTVATPLERQFSTIAGISQMSSVNSLGSTQITVQFNLSRNIDAAAQDISAAISAAGGLLPSTMPRPPSYQKTNPADQAIYYLSLTSDTLPPSKVSEYADLILAQRISMEAGCVARAGLRRAKIRGAGGCRSQSTGGAQHRHRRGAESDLGQQHQPSYGAPRWR